MTEISKLPGRQSIEVGRMALLQVYDWQPDSEFGRRRKLDNLRQIPRWLKQERSA